jgi:NHLM bacteriocin system ABC transporter ATP-binding protein
MTRTDPGVAFRSMTLETALQLVAPALEVEFTALSHNPGTAATGDDGVIEVVETLGMAAGLRSRRVLLDPRWWRAAGTPMVGRLAERRRASRDALPDSRPRASNTGWVALVPHPYEGYVMRAIDPETAAVVEWRVDAEIASRLAPHAFTFHRRFPARRLDAKSILRFVLDHGRRDLAFLIGAGLAAAVIGLLAPLATGWLIDRAIPSGATHTILAVIAGLAVAGVTLIVLDVVRTLAILRLEARIGVAMQAAIVDRVICAPAAFFRGFSSGDLALRMGAVNTVQRAITGSTIAAFVTSLFLLANIALMLHYSPALTAAALGIAALVVALSTGLGLARLRLGPRIEALDAQLGALTYELFAGIAKLRAGAAEGRAFTRWYAKYDGMRTASRDSARLENWETVALTLLQPAATLLVLWLAWRLPSGEALSIGDFVAFHAAMFALLGGVHVLVATALDLVNLEPVWDRARPILHTLPEDASAHGVRHDPHGAIELDAVSFAYPGGPNVLQDIRLTIAPGEFVAIVGASGSGKSTLMRLLLGFETPAQGSIRYDGQDLRRLDLRHLRGRLGTVLQSGQLWAGDLHTNIVGAAHLGVEAAWEAARRAGLAPDIDAMPMGMYTLVGEGLSTLSGGQRQRVLIARALVGSPRVLLLDEATSALDNLSQAKVLEGLARLEATRVVIAHRLNTVRGADRIVVLDRGRIVQAGTFEKLAAEQGPFSAMLTRQTP